MSQQDKVFLNMAGEFAVASELNRRRVLASVTYGSSKSADIFAMNPDMTKIVRIEVKTTDKQKWPIGEKATRVESQSADVFWVLVHLPTPSQGALDEGLRGAQAPRFFVLSAREIYEVWRKEADRYLEGYRARHGRTFDGVGVPNVTLGGVLDAEGKWDKITSRLKQSRA
ncbi:MAG: hypothetical protein ACREYF_18920 [Gammaproteobacteria bacterium]